MEAVSEYNVIYWNKDTAVTASVHNLLKEEPLSIRIDGKPYTVVMRTPGNEKNHVAGFCLGEGIIDRPDDLENIAFCDGADTNVVTATLTEERRRQVAGHLDRRTYISQTSCGLCGKEIVEELHQKISPITDDSVRIDIADALACLIRLPRHQPFRDLTRTSHAAMILNSSLSPLVSAEDVGRHSALDKAIGGLFLENRLHESSVLVLSSRISYEMVQKASRARIPIVLSMSRPTALAVEIGEKLNMTLACLNDKDGVIVFCGEHRVYIQWDAS